MGSNSSGVEKSVLEKKLSTELAAGMYDCKSYDEDRTILGRESVLVTDRVVSDDKEACFDVPNELASYFSDYVDSRDSDGDKDAPLVGEMAGVVPGKTRYGLENGGGQQVDDVVGRSPDNMEIMVTEHAQKNNHTDTELYILDEAVRSHGESGQEKLDMLDRENTDFIIQTQHREEGSCTLVRQLPNVTSDCTISHATGAVGNRAHIQLVPRKQERYGCNGDSNCSNLADSSSVPEIETKEKDNINIDLLSVSVASDVILSPVRRSTRGNKFCRKDETGNATVRSRKAVDKKLLQGENFLNAARRKRSCLFKPARSSLWGSELNIIKVKDSEVAQTDGNRSVHVGDQRSHKQIVGLGNERQKKNHTGSSSLSKDKGSNNHPSRIRLKVTMGRQNDKRGLSAVQSELSKYPAPDPSVGGKCVNKPNNRIREISKAGSNISTKLENGFSDGKHFTTYCHRLPENPVSSTDAHFLDYLHVEKDMESTVTQDTSVGNNFSCFPGVYTQVGTEAEEATGRQYSDPATSPDSEVISLTQNVSLCTDVLTIGQAVGSTDAAVSNMELIGSRKQINISQVKEITGSLATSLAAEQKSFGKNKKNKFGRHGKEEKHVYDPTNGNNSRSSSNAERHTNESLELDDLGKSLKVETVNKSCQMSEQSFGVKSAELLVPKVLLVADHAMDLKPSSESSVEVREQRSAASVSSRNRKKTSHEQRKGSRKSVTKKKIKEKNSVSKVAHDRKSHLETGGDINISSGMTEQLEPRKPAELIKGESMGFEIPTDPVTSIGNSFTSDKSPVLPSDLNGQVSPSPNAWVRCDDCFKWRCISTELADSIEATNCRWTCSDNMDKKFADCSIPQEKSNAAINAELELSEFSGDEDASTLHPVAKGFEVKQLRAPKEAPWKPIESNLFLHRRRKTQTIDETMICHCKPPPNGGLGCGDECLNRMLNIECARGTCPCGDRCSNQQFQQRKYAKLEHIRCGKKGYGLQLLESVSQGDFLIEYVGEVLDLNAYEARQREYASRGQRHFYFMTLNGSEVIDACAKGNLGRFINHSCDPNCCTEKWMVNGEVCIGLFALRNIKKGEELTFDYNYVRVFGAAVKKCVCGSSLCRGYIGGDPLNTDAIVLDDSDEEFPEPVMVGEDGETVQNTVETQCNTIFSDSDQLRYKDQIIVSTSSITQLESLIEKDRTACRSGDAVKDGTAIRSVDVRSVEILPPKEETVNETLSSVQTPEMFIEKESVMNKSYASATSTDTARKSVSDHVMSNGKTLSDSLGDGTNVSKARSLAKSSRVPGSIKKGKGRSNPLVTSKPQVLENKAKKVLESVANSHSKGVEEKLNELLDNDGGISKRKDAAKGYLKLLVLTASSGDNVNGEAVQSTRDLSIILDALLKTKKLNVLNDIISKNGLQMLHNIIKQNRKNFNRTPIIRKLLKILEYLAEKKILTLELINSPPPCEGMESFRESIFQLTNHNDMKVHRIARDFRDKWMPRNFRRNNYVNGDSISVEQQACPHGTSFPKYKQWNDPGWKAMPNFDHPRQTNPRAVLPYVNTQKDRSGPAVNSYPGSGPSVNSHPGNGTKSRKRKSRWDEPEKGNFGPQPLELREDQKAKPVPSLKQPDIREAVQDHVSQVNDETICDRRDDSISHPSEGAASVDAVEPILDDAPPGFPSQPLVPSGTPSTDTLKLIPNDHHRNCSCEVVTGCLQDRYDSSLPISFGVPLFFVEQLGTPQRESLDSWEISPGIPFHPFPPLPSYPRGSNTRPPHAVNRLENGESQSEGHRASHQPDADLPCTSGALSSEIPKTGNYHQEMSGRMGVPSGNIGRRYFKQQKWNYRRPPYFRDRKNGWGFKGNSSRDGGCSLGHVENEMENTQRTQNIGGEGNNGNHVRYQDSQRHC